MADAFVENPGGSVDIFYKPPIDRFDSGARELQQELLCAMGPAPRGVELRAAVDRTPELLAWAEQRAADYGIVLPYKQPDFTPTSVEPPPR